MKKCIVFIENGFTKVMLPSGEVLPSEVKGVLTQDVGDDKTGYKEAIYEVSFLVDVVGSKEEALKQLGIE